MRLSILLLVLALLNGAVAQARGDEVLFRRDVMAVFGKAGCNTGGCHGNGGGKGGFKLSLWGQDPDLDWAAVVREQSGRRVNLVEPERSLILQKATGELAHEGGKRFDEASPEYGVLLAWLRGGGADTGTEVKIARLEVTPGHQVLVEPAGEVPLKTVAHFSDGTQRDVTNFAVYEPNNMGAKVSHGGVVSRVAFGETTVLVRYLGEQVPVTFDFVPARQDFAWSEPPAANFIDELVFKKLRTLRMNPSEVCSDEVFVRRAYMDLLGVPPTAGTARAFVANADPGKRAALVDALLAREEFADFWALKWADLLRIEERQLDRTGMSKFHGWIRGSIASGKPMDQFARELVAARGSTYENPPANWYRANRDPIQRAENTARVFLGTQLNCAQCHNHPFEKWTQDDYYSWAAVFARVDYEIKDNKRKDENDKKEFKGDQIVKLKETASFKNARTGQPAEVLFLGKVKPETSAEKDELMAAAEWLSRSPMFARMQVNRIWYHLLGRGLVDPVDDFRASNPATQPELLEALARDFAEHGYDMRHVIRTIMRSRTYQLSTEPNATNAGDESFFSRGLVRRLGAEQIIDSMSKVLAAPLEFPGFPEAKRMAQVPEGRKHYHPIKTDIDRFAQTFGKPPRLVASECERTDEIAVPQVFTLIGGALPREMLTRKGNAIGALLDAGKSDGEIVDELSWSILSRAPSATERDRFYAHLAEAKDRRLAVEDIAWALTNAKEFLFRR